MFYDIYTKLCTSRGKSANAVAKELEIASGTVTEWKNGRVPRNSTLVKIADYFNVSVDFLLGTKQPFTQPIGDTVPLKVIASVKAGFGDEAIENWDDDYDSVPISLLHGYNAEECRIFTVKGNSMYPKILNGDKVIVHVQSSVDSGDTAIVIYNGNEGTIKKVRYATGENWLELIPINPEYETLRLENNELLECLVFGKVIGLIRTEI